MNSSNSRLVKPARRQRNFRDYFVGKGALRVRVIREADKRVLRTIAIPNQVCVGAQDAVQRLLTQTDPSDASECELWSIWCGVDGTAPAPGDLQLAETGAPGAANFRKVFDAPPTINLGGVTGLLQVQMTMLGGGGSEGDGFTYVEAGLFTQGPNADPTLVTPGIGVGNARMVARQVHAMIAKTAAISIEYTWRFQLLTV